MLLVIDGNVFNELELFEGVFGGNYRRLRVLVLFNRLIFQQGRIILRIRKAR